MTAKEEALELCVKFFKPSVFEYEEKQYLVDEERSKQSALICVDEMIGNYEEKYKYCKSKQFLEEVKQEINKL